jgi:opacity protein-like surface antigen
MYTKQSLAVVCALLGAGLYTPAHADEPAQPLAPATLSATGFYGGIALRQNGTDAAGVNLGHLTSAWGKFAPATLEDHASRTLFFGGYRWRNDLAVEAAFATVDRYTLQPMDAGERRGVGLHFASADPLAKRWNADVYTSWSIRQRVALYGRLGYAQNEVLPPYAAASFLQGDPRRARDGVNYGVGVRYDFSPALGLRVEYARFGRFAGETLTGFLPDSDQVQLGLQLRF